MSSTSDTHSGNQPKMRKHVVCDQGSRSGTGITRFTFLLLLVMVSCKKPKSSNTDPVLVGAADVASCDDLAGAEATAKLLDKIPGTVFVAGDLAYPDGSEVDFANCYGP